MNPFSLKILIVEDNLAFSLKLQMLLEQEGYFVCGRVKSSGEAIKKIYAERPDLILMDIDIEGAMTGIEVGQRIVDLEIPILYITSYADEKTYALAQESNMIGYLTKPINKISLRSGIQLAISKANSIKTSIINKQELAVANHIITKHSFFFKKRDSFQKVLTQDIAYIKASDNYCEIHTLAKVSFTARISMNKLEEMLPKTSFFRVHRQYIIQVAKIDSMRAEDKIVLVNETEIPVSRSNWKKFKDMVNLIS